LEKNTQNSNDQGANRIEQKKLKTISTDATKLSFSGIIEVEDNKLSQEFLFLQTLSNEFLRYNSKEPYYQC
jgi:hypothetical protein